MKTLELAQVVELDLETLSFVGGGEGDGGIGVLHEQMSYPLPPPAGSSSNVPPERETTLKDRP